MEVQQPACAAARSWMPRRRVITRFDRVKVTLLRVITRYDKAFVGLGGKRLGGVFRVITRCCVDKTCNYSVNTQTND